MRNPLYLSLIASTVAFQPGCRNGASSSRLYASLSTTGDYLANLSREKGTSAGGDWRSPANDASVVTPSLTPPSAIPPPTTTPPPVTRSTEVITFTHAPIGYFALDKLKSKGPRTNADVGQPHDATRPLIKGAAASVGSWWCAAGGWPSPALRATTEVFFVFHGRGCVTDLDGTRHEFGPGDTVILPKGWSGRWDVLEDIHKVWVVYDHPNVEETSTPIRAVIASYADLFNDLTTHGVRSDATHGSPTTASRTFYSVGPTEVGCWTCSPGSFSASKPRDWTESFHVIEGVFFLTNSDGSARRCVAGDTVQLPKGWSGHWDIIEPVRKLWVVTE